jgi:hypothetical protein
MAVWDRQTPWRQGSVLSAETLISLGLNSEAEENAIGVVISHDCDLAQGLEVEPALEIIVGKRVPRQDGNFSHAKNPRRGHFELTASDGEGVSIELFAPDKKFLQKANLEDYQPSKDLRFEPRQLAILQHWLAARYRRSAFSDEFEGRLSTTGLRGRLAKIVEPLGSKLIAVFFDVDGGQEITHIGDDDPFNLSIILLYSTDTDPNLAQQMAAEAAQKIEHEFETICKVAGNWVHIELLECTVISDNALTYALSTQLKKWNIDHMSLRSIPQRETLS